MLVDIATDLRTASGLYGSIESVREQLRALSSRLASDSRNADLRGRADSVEHHFMLVADSLTQQNPGAFYEWPVKLSSKLSYLAGNVQSSDYVPTNQARDAHTFLKGQLRVAKSAYDALVQNDLRAFNDQLRQRGLPAILVQQP
jgi:hypothetical protein